MRALKYFFAEAVASLWRGRRAALLAVLTIIAGLFVLGFFLLLTSNLDTIVARWSTAAEMSVYLRDDIGADQRSAVEAVLKATDLIDRYDYVAKAEALRRFKADFADLARLTDTFEENPLPASFEARLRPEAGRGEALDTLAQALARTPGVADVRYDRRWLSRLLAAMALLRGVGLIVVAVIGVAAALTVANVVRLAAYARREEISIMYLVGSPVAYIRGPFVVEGILQGGVGAMAALFLLWMGFLAVRARYGQMAAEALGIDALSFLSWGLVVVVLVGGMAVGCVGGLVAARSVREGR